MPIYKAVAMLHLFRSAALLLQMQMSCRFFLFRCELGLLKTPQTIRSQIPSFVCMPHLTLCKTNGTISLTACLNFPLDVPSRLSLWMIPPSILYHATLSFAPPLLSSLPEVP